MTNLPPLGDNYLSSLAADIQAAHIAVGHNAKAMAEHALTAGRLLNEAKDNLQHGEFGSWLRKHLSISERTARRYMTLAKSGVKTDTVADLGINGALDYASIVASIPIPSAGQVTRCTDDNGNLLFLWPSAEDANYIYKVWFWYIGNGEGVGAGRKPVHRDWLHRILLSGDFDGFNVGTSNFELFDYASDDLLKFLNDERCLTAPTWYEQHCGVAA